MMSKMMKSGGAAMMKKKMMAGGGMMSKGYAAGGKMPMKIDPQTGEKKPAFLNKGGMTKMSKGYAAGGMSGGHKAIDGIAKRGKTKGSQIK